MFDKIKWITKLRILSVLQSKNTVSSKNCKMLQLPTNIHILTQASSKLQNSINVSDWNIVAFQAFVMSCFGQ